MIGLRKFEGAEAEAIDVILSRNLEDLARIVGLDLAGTMMLVLPRILALGTQPAPEAWREYVLDTLDVLSVVEAGDGVRSQRAAKKASVSGNRWADAARASDEADDVRLAGRLT